jgi:hypothetical protein
LGPASSSSTHGKGVVRVVTVHEHVSRCSVCALRQQIAEQQQLRCKQATTSCSPRVNAACLCNLTRRLVTATRHPPQIVSQCCITLTQHW